ncbi:ribbon-helix-helix protein, CopG family [Streptomyces sp. NPDC049040]|uniref:ribbon-helix-helix protein, CopG family n=1 Tax=Streptomyces sp. NPDC049040 TaxID=3365593 RepID=UPI003713DA5E
MASRVLSLRVDADLWDRIRERAAKRGMTAQDYVVTALVRDDFDERFKAAVEETERFYGPRQDRTAPVPPYSSPSAGIR